MNDNAAARRDEPHAPPAEERPTRVRMAVIAVSVAMAFILYLDRICLGEIVKSASFKAEMPLDKGQIGTILSAFFFAYAITQVPSGWASDRFGPRLMLTIYIAGWSLMTALTGMAGGFWGILLARLGCGIFEAGAYPTSGSVIRRWTPYSQRARASSLVAFGGRIGGTLAPILTAWMIVAFANWRPALIIDGLVGLVIAAAYWHIVRTRPEEHPRCNEAERALLPRTADEKPPSLATLGRVLLATCRNRSVWLNCLVQTAVNMGWAFLITWLPTYLAEVWHVEPLAGGRMATVVLACGMIGMLCGGAFCDWTTRLLGPRWGRVAPIIVGSTLAGGAYLVCPWAPSAWAVVACCGLVSFGTDLGTPALWSFMQDVGGKSVGTIAGWGNMWGNFGAAAAAKILPWVVANLDANKDWHEVFLVCAGSYLVAILAALGMNSLERVEQTADQGG